MLDKSATKILKKLGFRDSDEVRTIAQLSAVKAAMGNSWDQAGKHHSGSYSNGGGCNNSGIISAHDLDDYELVQTSFEKRSEQLWIN